MSTKMIGRLLRLVSIVSLASLSSVYAGFTTQGTSLLDGNGNPFIMRGINYPHTWYTSNTATSIPDIANTGANAIRIVLSNGARWTLTPEAEVASIIQQCKDNGLIAILEVHDTTGYDEQAGSVPLSTAVDYWISIQGALLGEEDFVIINIGNEPLGNNWPASEWVDIHTTAISRLRNAGFSHCLMVDAANWGQDWEGISLANAPTVAASDPNQNVVFSVHMYDVYDNATIIDNYFSAFAGHNLPLVVGEFAADHGNRSDVDEASIMALCETYGNGYLGWSWAGNSRQLASLDIVVDFDPTQLTAWGDILINGPNGIAATSSPATVFGNVDVLNVSPSSLSFGPAANTDTLTVAANVSWTASADQSWITVSPESGSGDGSVFASVSENGTSQSRSGNVVIAGGSRSETIPVSQDGVSSATSMYVQNIAMSSSKKGPHTEASATVSIADENGNPVTNAVIDGTWSGVVSGADSITTDSSGSATSVSPRVRGGGTFTFTVDNVTGTEHSYNQSLNVETSDSITAQ